MKSGEMLIGQYLIKLGAKNRVAFPKKFRNEIGSSFVITRSYEKCLIIVSEKNWNEFVATIESKPFTYTDLRDTSRFILGGAFNIDECDSQGRFCIPNQLITYSGIKEDVVFVGLNKWVEVWSNELWLEREDYIFKNSSKIAERLNELS